MSLNLSTITVPTSVAASASLQVQSRGTSWLFIGSNTAATIQVQISPDDAIWNDYTDENGAGLFTNTDGYVVIPDSRNYIRVNVTAYTSGSPTCRVLDPEGYRHLEAGISDVDVGDDTRITLGENADFVLEWDTNETADAGKIALLANNRLHLIDHADLGTDTTLAAATDPTLTVWSNGVDKYVEMTHDDTDARINTSAGVLSLAFAGTDAFDVASTGITAEDAAGPAFLNEAASSTNPTLVPNKTEAGTGIGWNSTGVFSLIAQDTESFQVFSTGMQASTTTGPIIRNINAGASTPTLCPTKTDQDTGLGYPGPDRLSFVAGGFEAASVGDAASSATAMFSVNSPAGSVKPTVELTQSDDDEAFINYSGTSAGDATKSISTLTTSTVAGHIRCEINGTVQWIAFTGTPS